MSTVAAQIRFLLSLISDNQASCRIVVVDGVGDRRARVPADRARGPRVNGGCKHLDDSGNFGVQRLLRSADATGYIL